MDLLSSPRFAGIKPFDNKCWLSSPTMHGDEQRWVNEAIQTNWVSTVGANIDNIEMKIAELVGCNYAVALSCGTAALHLAIKLAGERLSGHARAGRGTLQGKKGFASAVLTLLHMRAEKQYLLIRKQTHGICLRKHLRRLLKYIRKSD